MDLRLNGLNPLSYQGVNAYSPPQFVSRTIAPTANDTQNFSLGTLWLYTNKTTNPYTQTVYMLVSLVGNRAIWTELGSGTGTVTSLTGNDSVVVTPTAGGTINLLGAHGINTVGTTNTETISITNAITLGDLASIIGSPAITLTTGDLTITAGNINLTNTNTAGTVGIVNYSGNRFISNYGTSNTFVGQVSGNTSLTTGSATFNSGFGFGSLTALTTGQLNSCFGIQSGLSLTTGNRNTFIGAGAGDVATTGSQNVALGYSSLGELTTGGDNTALGYNSLGTPSFNGSTNISIGKDSGISLAGTESNNVLIGFPGIVGTSGLMEIGIPGDTVPYVHNFGAGNSFFGRSGNLTLTPGTAVNNTGQGNTALAALTLGANNCAVGNAAGQSLTTGGNNAIVGAAAMQLATTSQQCTALGAGALNKITIAANQNVAIGYQSAFNLLTGTLNVCIGTSSGTSYTGAETNNIIIGGGATGTVGDSRFTRIGFGTASTLKTFIDGIAGITTDVNDAVPVLISATTGQLGVTSSSARYKENINDMLSYSNVLYKLRPVTFNYKKHSTKDISVGLIAEEVAVAAPQLAVYNSEGTPETVKYNDLIPLLLNELQRMNLKMSERDSLIGELIMRIELLERKLN